MPKKSKSKINSFKPPVVTIMGHVDHGKTTLLDKIRNSKIAAAEHGGITQNIGAYQVDYSGKRITFIDTPGHAAFSKMRARGAKITDIVVLVVAADDGVKPQTKESIKHIQTAAVPLIVAINKIDVKGASVEMVKAQLVEEGIQVEGYGGSTPVIEISALKGTNVDKLLETILILAELENISASPTAPLEAVVVESTLKKNQGPVTTLLIKQGTLKDRDKLVSVSTQPPVFGTAKKLYSDTGKVLKSAFPGTPVTLIGLKSVPSVGTIFTHPEHADTFSQKLKQTPKTKPKVIEAPKTKPKTKTAKPKDEKTDETQEDKKEEVEEKQAIPAIIKADTFGTLEAITQNLAEEIELVGSSTGQVTESDVLLAKSTKAVIIAFNVPVDPSAKKLADVDSVPIKSYSVIYELLQDFENQVLKLLEPTIDEVKLGEAKVLAIFNIRDKVIVGCKVISGKIALGGSIHLKRDDKLIADALVSSLKQGKEEVKIAKAGSECGIKLKPQLDIKIGDKLISFKKSKD